MEDIILYFVYKHQGDWGKIYQSISNHEVVSEEDMNAFKQQTFPPYVTLISANYPECFRAIDRPPFVVFYRGNWNLVEESFRIAVIGTRQSTSYGRQMTLHFVTDLVARGAVIVSGLANGIDGEAHRIALEAHGKTIAVLGYGHDHYYPLEHRELRETIDNQGLSISEYPPFVTPTKEQFPARNRLIAALAKSILVIESKIPSGTLSTVNHGLQQGKDIFCVPSRANEGSGCNRLIQQGAILVETIQDIMDYIPTMF